MSCSIVDACSHDARQCSFVASSHRGYSPEAATNFGSPRLFKLASSLCFSDWPIGCDGWTALMRTGLTRRGNCPQQGSGQRGLLLLHLADLAELAPKKPDLPYQ